MKRQDLVKYHQMDIPKLLSEVAELEKALVQNRLQQKMDNIKDVHEPIKIRKDIARLKTIIRHKQLTQPVNTTKKPTKLKSSKKSATKKTSDNKKQS